ncbi:A/G-specific adenine glycosylase [Candidatus Uhrbacteria bacterium]|nr:A/G-specific adenine glycosylase [Candidatus Uhrbacteria bacterium]
MKSWKKLLRWFGKNGRDLPWRGTQDPYRILVSEIMLQQTQVSRVKDYYRLWMKRFPSFGSLAKASNADVIYAWAGLGYNRRALMLRDIARTIIHNRLPESEDEWRALKGIGPYTAAAIAAFSLNKKTVPIDTNIRRVLGRVLLGKPFPDLKDDDRLKKLVKPQAPDVWQAAFDLATSICTKTPDCASCPLKTDCLAAPKFLSGNVKTPKRMVKKSNEKIYPGKKYPDRIYRGRILSIIRQKPTPISQIGPRIDPSFSSKDAIWLEHMVDRLIKDGLLRRIDKTLVLG